MNKAELAPQSLFDHCFVKAVIEEAKAVTAEFYAEALAALLVCQLLMNYSIDFRKKVNDSKELLE